MLRWMGYMWGITRTVIRIVRIRKDMRFYNLASMHGICVGEWRQETQDTLEKYTVNKQELGRLME
jgi:hypothetical protein